MKTLVSSGTLLIISFPDYVQKTNASIEIQQYFRYNKYPKYGYTGARTIDYPGTLLITFFCQ